MNETDQVLVGQSQRGDRAAFEELVRRTARLVFSRLYLETGNSDRAEDLAQETFLLAWRKIRQVTDPSGFRSWLFTIAQSVAIDAGRRDRRKRRAGTRQDAGRLTDLPDPALSPDQSAERNESRQQVLAVLRSMPEEYRLPLTLRYIAGADYETIGRQLGLTNGSLRGLLHRGMSRLREAMQLEKSLGSRDTGL